MSQSQKPWCRLDVSSLIRLCDFSLSLPPQWLWLCVCVSSCLPKPSECLLWCVVVHWFFLTYRNRHIWTTEKKKKERKKGAVALLCTHHNCLRKCSLTLSVHLSLGCSRTHRPSSCLPEWSEVLFCLLGLRRSTFCFLSSIVLVCGPIILHVWPSLPFSFEILDTFPVCVTTPAYTCFSVHLDKYFKEARPNKCFSLISNFSMLKVDTKHCSSCSHLNTSKLHCINH